MNDREVRFALCIKFLRCVESERFGCAVALGSGLVWSGGERADAGLRGVDGSGVAYGHCGIRCDGYY